MSQYFRIRSLAPSSNLEIIRENNHRPKMFAQPSLIQKFTENFAHGTFCIRTTLPTNSSTLILMYTQDMTGQIRLGES